VTLMWLRSINTWSDLMGEEGTSLPGFWFWCFVCCQQNWNHLNWVQPANSNIPFFIIKNTLFELWSSDLKLTFCFCQIAPEEENLLMSIY
jgi:hypothetical protein